MQCAKQSGKSAQIDIVITDVDGVLTDGGMYYSDRGDELKKFNVRDGAGAALLRAVGLKVGIISGEQMELTARRAKKMGMDFAYLGIKDKRTCLDQVAQRFGCDKRSIAYVGDEINDYLLVGSVGLLMVPFDACEDLKVCADIVLSRKGGDGVLREVAEILLREKGVYSQALELYVDSLRD